MFFCDRKTLGSTISMKSTMEETIKYGNKLGLYSIQICIGSPMVFNRKKINKDDMHNSHNYLKYNPINIYSHLPYVYNFAGSKGDNILNWTGNSLRDQKAYSMIQSVEYELDIISKICPDGCNNGCVLHVGAWKDKTKGLLTVSETINRIKFPEKSTLLLETMVGKGDVLGCNYEELYTIYNNIQDNIKSHIKICIDTCHIHSNGTYDLRTYNGIQNMFTEFTKYFDPEKLGLIHLNDSMTEFNSGKDRHELIGKGTIWNDPNRSVLTRLLDIIEDKGIPTVLETDEFDYRVIQEWNY
jgi:deoxyribonuclease IV